MKIRIATAFITCVALTGLSAQSASGITGGEADPFERSEYGKSADRAILNDETLRQANLQRAEVSVQQVGNGNQFNADITRTGTPSSVIVIQESGYNLNAGNTSNLSVSGSNNRIGITQRGIGNEYNGSINANDLNQSILQEGNFNEIDQMNANPVDGAGIQIQQYGNGNILEASELGGESTRQVRVTQRGGAKAQVTVTPN